MTDRILALVDRAKAGAQHLARQPEAARNRALDAIADAISTRTDAILEANEIDMAAATELSTALKDRLKLTPQRMTQVIRALTEVRELPDPLASQRELGHGRSGIRVTRRRIPLGVIAIVYESRPNVTAECAALTIKSGNAVVLRGGKEAKHSNEAFGAAIREGLVNADIDPNAVQVLAESSREEVQTLLAATGRVDLVIPRGGHGLMKMVDTYARVPVIRHGEGISQVYVDAAADVSMAAEIAFNAKVDRPGVCNAAETLILHRSVLAPVLNAVGPKFKDAGVELRADPPAKAALQAANIPVTDATKTDWDTEFLDLVLAIRTVDNLEDALTHIATHGTHHTATIVTNDASTAEQFLAYVDASCVLWNASTRFNDGGELGLGSEMGISTSKMHAYGPMSVTELTAEKLVVYGTGQVR